MRRPWRVAALVAGLALGMTGCVLTVVTTAEAEDIVVVEALLQLPEGLGAPAPRLQVFLHRTISGEQGAADPVDGADVRLVLPDGGELVADQIDLSACVSSLPVQGTGSCYGVNRGALRQIEAGARLRLVVTTAAGERMEADAQVPGEFEPITAPSGGFCRVEPLEPLTLTWTSSTGAWAYLSETSISGLPEAYADRGIEAPDPLDLLGLSVSSADTTIVLPGEFGIFDRADLDQDLALALQEGLPAGASAGVAIAAVDRNYVNWVRGGNFNPSGQVRIPSVRGEGTGWFGIGQLRFFTVLSGQEGARDCVSGPESTPSS